MFYTHRDREHSVLITGGTGFLGGYVRRALLKTHYSISQYPSKTYDLRDPAKCRECIEDARPDIIIHLAAKCGGIGANSAAPGQFFYDNMMMGMNIIEQARIQNVQKVVLVGTVCSYPSETPVPFNEDNLWNGYPEYTNSPYGIAKRALLTMAQSYAEQYGCKYAYIIPANLYGPGDNFNLNTSHVIPALIAKMVMAKALSEERINLWGDGTPTREFLYVEDAADAIVEAMEKMEQTITIGYPINIGSGEEVSIFKLAGLIKDMLNYRGELVFDTSRPNGQMRRAIDSSRAFKLLEWRPKVKLEEGLKRTIAYYETSIRNGGLRTGR